MRMMALLLVGLTGIALSSVPSSANGSGDIRPLSQCPAKSIVAREWKGRVAPPRAAHVRTLRDRKQWFEEVEGPILVLWWIPIGEIPTVAEAQERLQQLKDQGPTSRAFTFRTPYPTPDDPAVEADGLDATFSDWATHDQRPRHPPPA